jgi:hypothetical protein
MPKFSSKVPLELRVIEKKAISGSNTNAVIESNNDKTPALADQRVILSLDLSLNELGFIRLVYHKNYTQ